MISIHTNRSANGDSRHKQQSGRLVCCRKRERERERERERLIKQTDLYRVRYTQSRIIGAVRGANSQL